MKTEQKAQVLKGIYSEAIDMIIKAVEDRHSAIFKYERYLNTVEKTIKVFNPDFKMEKELELSSRGLDGGILRYVTRLDIQSQKEQLNFYQEVRRSL